MPGRKRPFWRTVMLGSGGIACSLGALHALVGSLHDLASLAPRLFADLVDSPQADISLGAFARGSAPLVYALFLVAAFVAVWSTLLLQCVYGWDDADDDGRWELVLSTVAGAGVGLDLQLLLTRRAPGWLYAPFAVLAVWALGSRIRRHGWRRALLLDEYARLWPSLWLIGLSSAVLLLLGAFALSLLGRAGSGRVLGWAVFLAPACCLALLRMASARSRIPSIVLSVRWVSALTVAAAAVVVLAGSITFAYKSAPALREQGRVPSGSTSRLLSRHVQCVDVTWLGGPAPPVVPATAIYLGTADNMVHLRRPPSEPIRLPIATVVTRKTDAERCLVQRGGSGRPQTRAMLANLV